MAVAELANRRPIKSREAGWAHWLAKRMADADLRPDLISGVSIAFALLGAALLLAAGVTEVAGVRAALLLGAAAMIQLRLVCNLLDGMVAEHGRSSSAGPIWNELPDRFSDVALLAAAGYSAGAGGLMFAVEIGWICACLALLTAYLREMGRGFGFAADFSGPMAKPQRMAALTIACVIGAAEPLWGWRGETLWVALMIVAIGTAITAARRTRTLARRLRDRKHSGGNA